MYKIKNKEYLLSDFIKIKNFLFPNNILRNIRKNTNINTEKCKNFNYLIGILKKI